MRYHRAVAGRASAQAALETRRSIVRAAADLTSVEGLESVSIGRLASILEMSKSGVIGQFGSKENLQLATVELVFAVFVERVWEPVRHLEPGLPRLLGVCRSWVTYAADPPYPGGCPVDQMTYDVDGRTGAVHDRLAEGRAQWRRTLVREVRRAVEAGDLPPSTDPEQVVFALRAIVSGITPSRALDGDAPLEQWALTAIRAVLGLPPQR